MVIVNIKQNIVLCVSKSKAFKKKECGNHLRASCLDPPSEGLGALLDSTVLKCTGFGVNPHQHHRHSPVPLNIRNIFSTEQEGSQMKLTKDYQASKKRITD